MLRHNIFEVDSSDKEAVLDILLQETSGVRRHCRG